MTTTARAERRGCLVPPEERFWERYSPRHEAPLSGVTSAVIHLLVLALILGVVWVHGVLKLDESEKPIVVDAVRLTEPAGTPGKIPGNGNDRERESLPDGPKPQVQLPLPPKHPPLTPAQLNQVKHVFGPDGEHIARYATGPLNSLMELSDAARDKVRRMTGGKNGDRGGRDKDKGAETNERRATVSEERLLRWSLLFNTRDSHDYLNQLAGLGGMIAVPLDDKGRFQLIRDLRNPGESKEEDLAALNRIYWIDDKTESVNGLFALLRREPPRYFVALFPRGLESRMLQLEREHSRVSDEKLIAETFFDVVRVGDRYDVRVRKVSLKP